MHARFDLRIPAVRDMLSALLERPEILAVQLEKPQVGVAVRVGFQLAYGWRWFHGRSLFAALEQAEAGLSHQPEDGESHG